MTARAWPLLLVVTLTVALAVPAGAQSGQELPAYRGITTVPPSDGLNVGGVYCGMCGRTAGAGAPPGSQEWLHDLRRQGGDSIGGPVGVAGEPGPGGPGPGGPGGGGAAGPGGGAGGGAGGPICAPVAPRPPTALWSAAPLPNTGDIATDPDVRGWTGLTTYFTWSGPSTITWTQTGTPGQAADCSPIPAPTSTFSAQVGRWHWDVGEAAMTTAEPQAEHFYERKGVYDLTVACEWAGDPAGAATVPCGQRDYEVWEIRSTPVGR